MCIELAASDVVVNIDPTRVRHAIDNLLANALRYAPHGSTITVTADVIQHVVVIRVHDQGPGVPPALQRHVFEPFVRAPTTDQNGHKPAGSGLGLAIAAAVATGHGGTVAFDLTTHIGICIELRLATAPPAPREPAPHPVNPWAGGGLIRLADGHGGGVLGTAHHATPRTRSSELKRDDRRRQWTCNGTAHPSAAPAPASPR